MDVKYLISNWEEALYKAEHIFNLASVKSFVTWEATDKYIASLYEQKIIGQGRTNEISNEQCAAEIEMNGMIWLCTLIEEEMWFPDLTGSCKQRRVDQDQHGCRKTCLQTVLGL